MMRRYWKNDNMIWHKRHTVDNNRDFFKMHSSQNTQRSNRNRYDVGIEIRSIGFVKCNISSDDSKGIIQVLFNQTKHHTTTTVTSSALHKQHGIKTKRVMIVFE
eukprot:92552_1